eukprot:jgi/Chrzof1/4582/Cz14g19040.t1
MASKEPKTSPEGTPKMRQPEENKDSLTEQAAAPLATVSSHSDPWPHYLMSAATGGAAVASYMRNDPRSAMIKAGIAAAYIAAGRMLVTGNPTLGYDLGTITSITLTAVSWPKAKAGDALATGIAALGGISTMTNGIKSYQMRTGKPKEMEYRRE